MNTRVRIDSGISVMPLRFTDKLPQMRDYLVLLGFSPRVTNDESWVDLVGASGMVALHSVATSSEGMQPGQSGLSFAINDAEEMAERFRAAGYEDVSVYDEAYGRVARIDGPEGTIVTFDEGSDDHYGYRLDTPRPENGIVSMPVLFDAPAGPFARVLEVAGFHRLDEGDDRYWRVWSRDGGGLVALHPPTGERAAGTVEIAFRTEERLDALAERLRTAGFSDVAVTEERGGELTVTDPDGLPSLVQPVP